jgi:hypothetical protein
LTSYNLGNYEDDYYVVDEFNKPLSDNWVGRYDDFDSIYTINDENGNQYLTASSLNSANFIIKQINVDLAVYPFLNWRWRAHELPIDGDESIKQKCDVPASIAIVLNKSKIIPKSIKYSWSTTLPDGEITKSPFAFWPARCDIKVMEHGEKNKGKWAYEKTNVLEDYKYFYKKNNVKSKVVNAIVIMSDSDNTGTLSKADYDDIYFSKN